MARAFKGHISGDSAEAAGQGRARVDGREQTVQRSEPPPASGFVARSVPGPTTRVGCPTAVLEDVESDGSRRMEEAVDEFLAMLAHELRNPLAAINNAMQVWLRTDRQEDVEWIKGVIDRQSKHLTRLINELLDVSLVTRGTTELRKEHVDLVALVNRAVGKVRPLFDQKKLNLNVSTGGRWIELFADPARIEQVLVNLLTNAAKYTQQGGNIRLAVDAGDVVHVTVTDDGAGIPPEMLHRIFDPLVQLNPTLDRAQGGLGIGLTLVKNLVALHGGTVSAASDGVGTGSRFTIRLPAFAETAVSRARSRPAAMPSTQAPLRVLVVEDNRDSAGGLIKLLHMAGHHVIAAGDGPTAIQNARIERPEVVLMDIGLPGMDGYQVAEQLRKENGCEGALLVAISGYGQAHDRRRSRDAGFDHHLVKPVDVEELFDLLASRCDAALEPAG